MKEVIHLRESPTVKFRAINKFSANQKVHSCIKTIKLKFSNTTFPKYLK